MLGKDGSIVKEFEDKDYLQYIAEYVYPHSYMKAPYYKPMGWENGMYRVSPLSRINVCDKIDTPLATGRAGRVPQGIRQAGPADPPVPLRPAH